MTHNFETNADQTVQGFGIKKSDFVDQGTDAFAGTATIDVVINGENKKQSLDNFLSNLDLAVLVPVGSSPTPILEISGANNNIRGIEDGSGIKSSVSPGNGVLLEHNFQAGSGGASIFTDLTADSPIIGDLIAGAGISVAEVTGGVQIAVAGTPVSTKTIIINEMSDFPAAVGGVRTLEGSKQYFITNDLSTADRFNVSAGDIVIQASDSSVVKFEYTGSGTMFTGVDATFRLGRITVSAPNGRIWDLSDSTGTKLFQFIDGTVGECDKVGIIRGPGSGFQAVQINNVALLNIASDGVEFTGTQGAFFALTTIGVITSGAIFNLGTAVFSAISIDDNLVTLIGGGSNFISGASGSANIASGGLGTVLNSRFSGAGTILAGVTPDDDRWQFSLNDDIRDTRTDALLSLSGNAIETVIGTINTPVKVNAGTAWIAESSSQFTLNTNGRATYTGGKPARLPISIASTIQMASGGAKNITAYVAINGTEVAASGAGGSVSTTAGRIGTIWQHTFQPNDFVELFVENNSDTTNIVVTDSVSREN